MHHEEVREKLKIESGRINTRYISLYNTKEPRTNLLTPYQEGYINIGVTCSALGGRHDTEVHLPI